MEMKSSVEVIGEVVKITAEVYDGEKVVGNAHTAFGKEDFDGDLHEYESELIAVAIQRAMFNGVALSPGCEEHMEIWLPPSYKKEVKDE